MSVMMEAWEWTRVFDALPEASAGEMRVFMERRRGEMAEELREFDEKWEGRTVNAERQRSRGQSCSSEALGL